MAALFASTWGNPNATSRVFLLHGISSSSLSWHHVATDFASRGWFVTAPNLLGFGHHSRHSSDYSVATLADGLRPFLDHPYDIVIGHSLGALVVSSLLPLLKSTRPVHVVLSDPPLEMSPEQVAYHRATRVRAVGNPKSPDAYQQENPSYTREDAIIKSLNLHLCDITTLEAIFDQNLPWSFSHLLLTAPDNVKLTVLAADPSKGACIREEDLKPYPHVATQTVWGSSHSMHIVFPRVIVEAALQGCNHVNNSQVTLPAPFASTWGDPNGTKRALLVHGSTSSPLSWHHVAHDLASRGWFVTAPYLFGCLGHHARHSSDYTVTTLADELEPFLKNDHPYDIVIGASFGSLVVATLLPHLKSTRSVHVVLSDPPLELNPEQVIHERENRVCSIKDLKSPDAYQQENPSCTREDAIIQSIDKHLCDVAAVEAIMDQNQPWSFPDLLSTAPDNVKLTVLAADPSKGACIREEDLKLYPHVTAKTVWGSPHAIHVVSPRAIVEAALEGCQL